MGHRIPHLPLDQHRLVALNVHADLRVEATDRDGRHRLIRYALRPPFAYDQITLTSDGRIAPFGYCFAAPGGTL